MTGIATAYSHHRRPKQAPVEYPAVTTVSSSRKRCFPQPVVLVTGAMVLEQPQIMDNVASFLTLSELHRLSVTSKQLMHQLLKHEFIIRAALLGGEKDAQITIKRLVELIRKGQIFVPSPIRMLRLARGKRCEFCHQHRVEHVSRYFGVFSCFQGDCRSRQFVAQLQMGYNDEHIKAYLEHPRVAKDIRVQTGKYRKVHVWKRPLLESGASNQFYGPIITLEHMHTWSTMKKTQFLVPEQEFLNKYLKDVDGEDDEHKISAQSIFQVYDMYEQRLKMHKQQQSAREKLNQARMQGTLFMISALSQMLGDVPWRSAIFTYQLTKYYAHETTETDFVIARFKSPLVEEVLHPLAMDPHKATREQLKKVASHLKRQFNFIWSKHFGDTSFLLKTSRLEKKENGLKRSSETFEEMLYRQLKHSETGSTEQLPQLYLLCNRAALKLIQQNKLVEALYLLLPSRVRLAATREIVEEYFRKSTPVERTMAVHAHKLACGLWDFVVERQQKSRQPLKTKVNGQGEKTTTDHSTGKSGDISCADPRVVYEICRINFPKVFQAAVAFVQYASASSTNPKKGKHAREGRAEIASRVWSGKAHIIQFLFQQDFEGLRRALKRNRKP